MTRDPGTAGSGMMVVVRDGVPVARFTTRDFGNPSLLEVTFQVLIAALKHRKVVVDLSDIDNTMSLGTCGSRRGARAGAHPQDEAGLRGGQSGRQEARGR